MSPVVEALATAFEPDPLFVVLFPDQRAAALQEWFEAVVEILGGCRYAELSAEAESVALWTTRTCADCLGVLSERLIEVVRRRSGPVGRDVPAWVADGAPDLADEPWGLHWLAVAPAARGTGRGTRLLRELTDRAAAAGAAVYTETANPAAARFYRRNGFVALREQSLPAAPGVVYRRFLRAPGGD